MKKQILSAEFNFAATARHPLALRGIVEMLPTAWIQALGNKKVTDKTNLDLSGAPLVDMDALWRDMAGNGMRDPFILSAGRYTRDCRLESGNHRIGLFSSRGVPYVPAVTLVADDCIISPLDGPHRYKRALLLPPQNYTHGPFDERTYMAPSSVFTAIHKLKESGGVTVLQPQP